MSQRYRLLKIGESIKIGDEFQGKHGNWITFEREDQFLFMGKPHIIDFGDLPVRRKIDDRGRDLAGEVSNDSV
jgi:hypothetical protein